MDGDVVCCGGVGGGGGWHRLIGSCFGHCHSSIDCAEARTSHHMMPAPRFHTWCSCRHHRPHTHPQVVKEELELGYRPEVVHGPAPNAAQAQLSATLSSKEFSLAVAVLVKKFSPEDAAVGIDSTGGTATAGTGGTFEARANAAAARLEGFSVVFVKELRSRFLRLGEREGGVRGEEDITAANGATGSVFFVREVREIEGLVVCRESLPCSRVESTSCIQGHFLENRG